MDEGVLAAAEDVLTVEYKGTITHASLTADGRIKWKGAHNQPLCYITADITQVACKGARTVLLSGASLHTAELLRQQ